MSAVDLAGSWFNLKTLELPLIGGPTAVEILASNHLPDNQPTNFLIVVLHGPNPLSRKKKPVLIDYSKG